MQLISLSWLCGRNTRRGPSHRLKTNLLCLAALFLFALMPSVGWAQETRNVSNSRDLSEALEADGTIVINITRDFDLDSNHVAIYRANNNIKKYFSSAILVRGTKTINGTVNGIRHTIFRGPYRNSTFIFAEDASLTINGLTFDGEGYSNHGPLFALDAYPDTKGNLINTNASLTMNNCIIKECTAKTAFDSDGYFDVSGGGSGLETFYVNPMNPNSSNYIFPVTDTANWNFKWYSNFSTGGAAIHFDPLKKAADNNDNDNTLTLNGCTFQNNEWSERDGYGSYTNGGAIYLGLEKSHGGTFTNCTFEENRAGGATQGVGGAIYFSNAAHPSFSYPYRFTGNTVITGNSCGLDGGGIFLDGGKAIFEQAVTISNNTAKRGGGIFQRNGELHITTNGNNNSQKIIIDSNTANNDTNSEGGGGIEIAGGVTDFVGTESNPIQITNNKAPNADGGGIWVGQASPSFTHCIIGSSGNGNSANNGGGICLNSTAASFTNCNIEYNYTTGSDSYGGGVSCLGAFTRLSTFNNCSISYNGENGTYKTKYGGGLYMDSDNGILKGGCNVHDNTAENGGGIYYKYGSFENTNYVYSNTATSNGGGVYVDVSSSMELQGLVIGTNNAEANNIGNKARNGGGVYTYSSNGSDHCITINNCKIVYNKVDADSATIATGGGLCMANQVSASDRSHKVKLTGGTIIDQNEAKNGGGVYVTNGGTLTLQLTDATLSNNKATAGHGGGIYNNNQTVTSAGATSIVVIKGNEALAGNGGGIYNDGTTEFNAGTTTFENNKATNNGGGIYNGWQVTQAEGSTLAFDNNTATRNGGGVYHTRSIAGAGNSDLTLNGATFRGNQAMEGGGIYTDYICNLNGCQIGQSGDGNGNSALNGGGIYKRKNGMLTINGGKVSNNTASNNGGGIYLEQNDAVVNNNCHIEGNKATNDGGGIYLNGQHGFESGSYYFYSCAILKHDGITEGHTIDSTKLRVVSGTNVTLFEYGSVISGSYLHIQNDGMISNLGIYYYEETSDIEVGTDGDYFLLRLKEKNFNNVFAEVKVPVSYDPGSPLFPNLFPPNYYYESNGDVQVENYGAPAISSTITLNGCTVGNGNEAVNGKGGGIYISDNATANLSGSNVQSNTAGTFGGGVYISTDANMGVSGAVKVEDNTTKRSSATYPYLKESSEDDVCLQTIKALAKGVITHNKGKIKLNDAITGSWIGITEEEIATVTDNTNVRLHNEEGNYYRQFTIDYGDNHVENDVTKFFFSNDKVFKVVKLPASNATYQTSTNKLEVTLGIPPLVYWYVAGIVDDNSHTWGDDQNNSGLFPDVPCRTLTGPEGVFARGYDPDNPYHHIFVVRAISIDEEAKVRTTSDVVVIRYPEGDTYNYGWFANGTNQIPNAAGSREIVLNRYPGKHELSNGIIDAGGGAPGASPQTGPGTNVGPIVQMNAAKEAVLYNITLDGLKHHDGVTDPSYNPGGASISPTSASLAVEETPISGSNIGTITLKERCKVQQNNNKNGTDNSGASAPANKEKRIGGGVYCAGTLVAEDLTVTTNNCATTGGGIHIAGTGTATLDEGCKVTHNTASNCGGGVYIDSNATLELNGSGTDGVLIKHNHGNSKGGGVYKLGSLKVQGKVTITDNTSGQ